MALGADSPEPPLRSLLCTSRISHVAVYARGAMVKREVVLPAQTGSLGSLPAQLPAGQVELVIEGISPLAEPGSFRAALVGSGGSGATNRQIVSVRSALHVPETTAKPGPSAARLLELAGRQLRMKAEIERLQQQRGRLGRATPDPALRTTSLSEKVAERIADALATSELLGEMQARIDERLAFLEQELSAVQAALSAAELEHSQARSSENLSSGRGHPTRRAIITLSALQGGSDAGAIAPSGFTITYVVPAARFWPRYTLRIVESREGGDGRSDSGRDLGRRATWLIEALVAQRTGEDWKEARLSLSTADLLLDARLPELPSLRLGRAQPPARRGYRPPPGGLEELFVGYDATFGGRPSVGGKGSGRITDDGEAFGYAESALDDEGVSARDLDSLEATVPAEQRSRMAPKAGLLGRSSAAPAMPSSMMMTAPGGPAPQFSMPPAPGSYGHGGAPQSTGGAPMAPSGAIAPMKRRAGSPARGGPMRERSEQATTLGDGAAGGGGFGGYGGAGDEESDGGASSLEPQEAWLDFDRLVLGTAEDRSHRGRLVRTLDSASLTSARHANEQIEALRPGDGLSDPQDSRGHFDHRYDAEGLVLIPSDGLAHRVTISSTETVPALRLLSVPRERPEVYREAELKNPSEAPLLAGPVDVYVEGSLLTTAAIAAIDRGGALRIGMGVEERVRVARNVRSDEESVGLLGGSTQVTHHVNIELSSALGQPCTVEILERLPVSDDKAVTIELTGARPEPKEYTQAERGSPIRGGLVWRLLLPAGGKAKLDYQYRVTFPGRTEIVGGNRRD